MSDDPKPNSAENLEPAARAIGEIAGPLVVFYGPGNVGKTVALLRLCRFLSPHYDITPDRAFRSDDDYPTTIDSFLNDLQASVFAPSNTGAVNFLLLNLHRAGDLYCQILEAPGEHFFSRTGPTTRPFYMNTIFAADYRKIYVIFFEPDQLRNSEQLHHYVAGIVASLQQHLRPKRDRIIVILNKCDELPGLYLNGSPKIRAFRKHFFGHAATQPLVTYFHASHLPRIPFIPFSSGVFTQTSHGKTFAMSSARFPSRLAHALHVGVTGGSRLFDLSWLSSLFSR